MGATEVPSQTNVAKLESSYQALPSSSIALQFLHGLIRGRSFSPRAGKESRPHRGLGPRRLSKTKDSWWTAGGDKPSGSGHDARFSGYGSTPVLEKLQGGHQTWT
ncbi:unnamed protein product [Prunus brigantina]